MSKLLALVYNGFSEVELSFPISMFSILGGIKYDIVALEAKEVTGWAGVKVVASKQLKDISPQDYDALLLPGISPFMVDDLIQKEQLLDLVKTMHDNKKVLASICLTPLIFAKAGILKNKSLTSDASAEFYSDFEVGEVLDLPIVIEGNIITAKGPAFINLTGALFKTLGHAELADKFFTMLRDKGKIKLES